MGLLVAFGIVCGTLAWSLLFWLARNRTASRAYGCSFTLLVVPLGAVVVAAALGVGYVLLAIVTVYPKATLALCLTGAPMLLLIRLIDPAFSLDRYSAYFPVKGKWLRYLIAALCLVALVLLIGLACVLVAANK